MKSVAASGKKKAWRPLKQVLQTEQALPWDTDEVSLATGLKKKLKYLNLI